MIALAGKLAPLFAIFVFQMAVELLIIHTAYGIPFRGHAAMMAVSACLLIGAYQGLAALLVLLVRNLALGLSLTGIMVSPAFGYAGVGFPIIGMLPFAQHWGMILPLRWYMQILFDQAARGAPVADSASAFAVLGGLALLYLGLAWWRLAAVGRLAKTPRAATTVNRVPVQRRHGIILTEIRRIVGDRSVLGFMVIAPMLYGIFYPQPYLGQTLRHVPIAVVDLDLTQGTLAQMLGWRMPLTRTVMASIVSLRRWAGGPTRRSRRWTAGKARWRPRPRLPEHPFRRFVEQLPVRAREEEIA